MRVQQLYDRGDVIDGNVGLEEFIADHLGMGIAAKYKLPFMISKLDVLDDHISFDKILEQASMSKQDLLGYLLHSDIEGFLVHIAEGAKHSTFTDERDKLQFGFERLMQNSIALRIPPFERHYTISRRPYYYTLRPGVKVDGATNGCKR